MSSYLLPLASVLALHLGAGAQQCPIAVDANPLVIHFPSNVSAATHSATFEDREGFVELNGEWFFSAKNLANGGQELYKTDGTSLGTVLVKDIDPTGDSVVGSLRKAGGKLFFTASNGINGRELWTSDGTAAGTSMVLDIIPGAGDANIQHIEVMGAKVVFMADDGVHGYELWVSDGTQLGTHLVSDLNPGSASSWPGALTYESSKAVLYFMANDGTHGYELWTFDPATGAVVLVKDILPGFASSAPIELTAWKGDVYFIASSPGAGEELWVTDGTSAGTQMLRDIRPGSLGSDLRLEFAEAFNGKLYFSADDGVQGLELWETDGTGPGTQLAADILPGSQSSGPVWMTPASGFMVFQANGGPLVGNELFALDTAGNVQLLADIAPGGASSLIEYKFTATSLGGLVVFAAFPPSGDPELWKTDGTAVGTQLITQVPALLPFPSSMDSVTAAGSSSILFAGGRSGGLELWTSDLTPAGTHVVKYIETKIVPYSSNPWKLRSRGDSELVFNIQNNLDFEYYWSWTAAQGGAAGTSFVHASPNYLPYEPYRTWLDGEDITFFLNSLSIDLDKLFVSKGSPSVVSQVPGFHGKASRGFTRLGDRVLYFTLIGGDPYGIGAVNTLYASDGTGLGTSKVLDLPFDGFTTALGTPMMVRSGDQAFFLAYDVDPQDPTKSIALLWSTDGTAAGTAPIANSSLYGIPFYDTAVMVDFKGRLHFTIMAPGGIELWATDGSLPGTEMLLQTGVGFQFGGAVLDPRVMGAHMLFVVDLPASRHELYATDGSAAGTQLIASFDAGLTTEPIQLSDSLGSTTYFSVHRPGGSPELWVTDGTTLGTALVASIPNAVADSKITDLVQGGGGVYFVAETTLAGAEVWFSDGSPAGTNMVCDLVLGAGTSDPKELLMVDGHLFFIAQSDAYGRELFYVPSAAPAVAELGTPGEASGYITSSMPKLGGPIDVMGFGVAPGDLSLLLMSGPVSAPSTQLTGSADSSWLDPLTVRLLGVYTSSNWTWSAVIPASPALAGLKVHLQSYLLPGGSLPAATSNGLGLVFG